MKTDFANLMLALVTAFGLTEAAFSKPLDGYKNVKFGINQLALQKIHPCRLTFGKPDAHGVATGTCYDLPFNGTKTSGIFFLIDNKLLRVGIEAGNSSANFLQVAKGLVAKYGKADAGTFFDAAQAYDEGKVNDLDMKWSDGVILSISRSGQSETVMLIYSDASYDSIYTSKQQKSMAQDL